MRRIVALAVVLGSLSRGDYAMKPSAPPIDEPLTPELKMVHMEPDRIKELGEQRLAIYCYPGQNQTWKDTFRTVNINVDCMGKKCDVYLAKQLDEILQHWKRGQRLLLLTGRYHSIQIDPFNPSCVGVEAATPYSIDLAVYQVDISRLTSFLIGCIIINMGNPVFRNIFCFLAYWIVTGFIVLLNTFSCILGVMYYIDDNSNLNATKYKLWLLCVSINMIVGALFHRLPPRVADTLIRIVARLILIVVGNLLMNWGMNSYEPTSLVIAGFRATYHEIFN